MAVKQNSWMYDTIVALMGETVGIPDMPVKDLPNPYKLDKVRKPSAILITHDWLRWANQQGVGTEEAIKKLGKIGAPIIGVDGSDGFELFFNAIELGYLDRCIKTQGIYNDRSLYNYNQGSRWPLEVRNKQQRNKEKYVTPQLDKIVLGLPCFYGTIPAIRKKVRKLKVRSEVELRFKNSIDDLLNSSLPLLTLIPTKRGALHFIGSLTNYSRYQYCKKLIEAGIRGTYGITYVPEVVFGHLEETFRLTNEERLRLKESITHEGIAVKSRNRIRYLVEMLNHEFVWAPEGYGELSFRMGEAWQAQRTLLIPDVSHVDIAFPLKDGSNCIMIKHEPHVGHQIKAIMASTSHLIAKDGHKQWNEWSADWEGLFQRYFYEYL